MVLPRPHLAKLLPYPRDALLLLLLFFLLSFFFFFGGGHFSVNIPGKVGVLYPTGERLGVAEAEILQVGCPSCRPANNHQRWQSSEALHKLMTFFDP